MQDQPVAPGQLLAGKYRIDRVLGAGAMGMVLGATHLVLGSRVAIKVMLGGDVMLGGSKKGPVQEQRFFREARVASMLKSEHAGKVLDVGLTEQGAPYIVMEYLEGKDLGALLDERGPLSVAEAATYVLQVCEAIAEAHGLGIVHRDIKPANLFLTTGVGGVPCVKLVDFGVAKHVDGAQGLTQTGAALGSPLYMSPEQMNGKRGVDFRADIWALGVTLFQLLAGRTPFHADSIMVVMTHVLLEPPTPLVTFRPDVPAGLSAVISQCLEKDPARRWPNVAAFAAALAPYATPASAGYAQRVANVQKTEVPPSRPTDLLPPEPKAEDAATPWIAPPAPTAPPASAAAPRTAVALVVGLALAAAIFFGLRARGSGPEGTVTPTSRPEASAAPISSVAASTDTAVALVATAPPTSAAPPSAAPVPRTAASAQATPRAKPTVVPKAPPVVGFPGGSDSRH
jgi:serine/threonine protein kinase